MKKILSVLIVLCMTVMAIPFSTMTVSATPQEDYIDEKGYATDSEWTGIDDEAGFIAMRSATSGNYYLTADIEITSELVNLSASFSGTFDGCGYSVTVKSGVILSERALFTKQLKGTIKNVVIGAPDKHIIATTIEANQGIIAGDAIGATLTDITVYADITNNRVGTCNAGGFLGKCTGDVTVERCSFYGTGIVSASQENQRHFGGIIGNVATTGTVTITDCLNFADIESFVVGANSGTATNSAQRSACAGIVATVSTMATLNITECKNFGDIAVLGTVDGGITGNLQKGTEIKITKCANFGVITSGRAEECGGITGCIWAAVVPVYAETNNCSFSKDDITMIDGASIRISTPTGLRFKTLLEGEADYDSLIAIFGEANVKLGTVIAPTAFVTAAGEFTKAKLDEWKTENAISSVAYVDIPYTAAGTWLTTTEQGKVFCGSIVGITEEHYELSYSGVGYVSVCIEGEWFTVYADYEATNSRSVKAVAMSANSDRVTESGIEGYENYIAADNNYSPFTVEELAAISAFIN